MAKRGRPPKHSDDDITALVAAFKEYIEVTDMPVIAEFAYKHDIDKTLIYDKEEFSTLRKKAIAKKEAHIEVKALKGEYNPTMAIFSLKQLGWKDKHEVDQNIANKDGKPFETRTNLSALTTQELMQLEQILSKTADAG